MCLGRDPESTAARGRGGRAPAFAAGVQQQALIGPVEAGRQTVVDTLREANNHLDRIIEFLYWMACPENRIANIGLLNLLGNKPS